MGKEVGVKGTSGPNRVLIAGLGVAAVIAGVVALQWGKDMGSPSGHAMGACADGDPQTHAVIARPPAIRAQVVPLGAGAPYLLGGYPTTITGIALDPSVSRVYARDTDNYIYVSDAKTGMHIETIDVLRQVATLPGGGLDTRCGELLADVDGGGGRIAVVDPAAKTVALERALPLTKGESIGAIAYRLDDDAVLLLVRSPLGATIREISTGGAILGEHPLPSGLQETALEIEPGANELIGIVTAGDHLARSIDLATGGYTPQAFGVPHGPAGDMSLTVAAGGDVPLKPEPPFRKPKPPTDQPEPPPEEEGRPTTGDSIGVCPAQECDDTCVAGLEKAAQTVAGVCEGGWDQALGHHCGGTEVECVADLSDEALVAQIKEALEQVLLQQSLAAKETAIYQKTGSVTECTVTRKHLENAETDLHNLMAELYARRLRELAKNPAPAGECDVLAAVRDGMKRGPAIMAAEIGVVLSIVGVLDLLAVAAAEGVGAALVQVVTPSAEGMLLEALQSVLGIDTLTTDLNGLLVGYMDLPSIFGNTEECPATCSVPGDSPQGLLPPK